MVHRRTAAAAGLALVAALVALPTTTTAGAAAGPTVSVDKPCYVDTSTAVQLITVTGSGWGPNDTIDLIDSSDHIDTQVNANAAGVFTATVKAPYFDDTKHAYDTDAITASVATATGGTTTPMTATSARFAYTQLAVTAPASIKSLTARLTFSFTGFDGGSRLYGHYIFRHKLRANVDLGRVSGPCGDLHAAMRIYPPSATPAAGDWTVQFDNDPHYSARTLPHYRTGFSIAAH